MTTTARKLRFTNNLMVKIDPELHAQLAEAAERERLSMSALVRRAVSVALASAANHSQASHAQ